MHKDVLFQTIILYFFCLFQSVALAASTTDDPLPSWNNTSVKQNIIHFVHSVTDKNNKDYTEIKNRIATIDNDGTLWIEQPMYTQLIYSFDKIKSLASQHPEWKTQEPFKSVLTNNIKNLTQPDLIKILVISHTGMTVDDFKKNVASWLAVTKNSRFDRPYTELVYQPMLELMSYLRRNYFKIYIVSGGGQDFIRTYAEKIYGIPPEQVIGTTTKTKYIYKNGQSSLLKLPVLLFLDDKEGKPAAIDLFIGQRPLMAFGNSDGDRQMLEWTQGRSGPHFEALIHHDDAQREFAYGPASKVGTFSDSLMKEAKERAWNVVSMKRDWKIIFPMSLLGERQ